MSEALNLDAARAARQEQTKTKPTIKFGKKVFTLPVEMPFTVLEKVGKVNPEDPSSGTVVVLSMLKELLGDQYDSFMSLKPSAKDMELVMEYVNECYGFASTGEPGASAE